MSARYSFHTTRIFKAFSKEVSGTKEESMSMKLYVGNLSYRTSDSELQNLFSQAGQVQSAILITDRETGRSRGFGFVEMASREEGERAIREFNGKEVNGRTLTVNEARPREAGRNGGSSGRPARGPSRWDE